MKESANSYYSASSLLIGSTHVKRNELDLLRIRQELIQVVDTFDVRLDELRLSRFVLSSLDEV